MSRYDWRVNWQILREPYVYYHHHTTKRESGGGRDNYAGNFSFHRFDYEKALSRIDLLETQLTHSLQHTQPPSLSPAQPVTAKEGEPSSTASTGAPSTSGSTSSMSSTSEPTPLQDVKGKTVTNDEVYRLLILFSSFLSCITSLSSSY